MKRLWRTIGRWLRSDRIRASPDEGAIYRLTPASIVVASGRRFEILDSQIVTLASGPAIVYDCDSEQGPCRLFAVIGSDLPRLVLVEDDRAVPLAPDDVQLFPYRGLRGRGHSSGDRASTTAMHPARRADTT